MSKLKLNVRLSASVSLASDRSDREENDEPVVRHLLLSDGIHAEVDVLNTHTPRLHELQATALSQP